MAAALVAAGARESAAQQRGVVQGQVTDRTGSPLLGARLSARGHAVEAQSDADGRFTLPIASPGPVTILARRLGYRPGEVTILVTAGDSVRVVVQLEPTAASLAPVRVAARAEPYASRLSGYQARRQSGRGHHIGRERIDQANSRSVIDLLRTAPGVRVVRGGRWGPVETIRFRGAGCPPLLFIDGVPATAGEFDFGMIDLRTIEAIELYSSLATVPPEFLGPRGLDRCGVIAIWSRPYRPREASPLPTRDPQALVASGEVYTADAVDIAARLQDHTVAPELPDSVWQHHERGRVVAEFVVASDGSVEMNTVVIITSTAPVFADAVRRALSRTEFLPARRDGRRVRQVVHQPFELTPSPDVKRGTPSAAPRS